MLLNTKFFSRKAKKSKAEGSKNVGSTTNDVDDDLDALKQGHKKPTKMCDLLQRFV